MLYLWQQGQIVFMLAEQPVAVQARDTRPNRIHPGG
jgi:hypothetical protein